MKVHIRVVKDGEYGYVLCVCEVHCDGSETSIEAHYLMPWEVARVRDEVRGRWSDLDVKVIMDEMLSVGA